MPGLSWGAGARSLLPSRMPVIRKQRDPDPGPHVLGTGTCDSERQGSHEAAPLGQRHQELRLFTPARGTPCGVEGPARADGPRLPQARTPRPH